MRIDCIFGRNNERIISYNVSHQFCPTCLLSYAKGEKPMNKLPTGVPTIITCNTPNIIQTVRDESVVLKIQNTSNVGSIVTVGELPKIAVKEKDITLIKTSVDSMDKIKSVVENYLDESQIAVKHFSTNFCDHKDHSNFLKKLNDNYKLSIYQTF